MVTVCRRQEAESDRQPAGGENGDGGKGGLQTFFLTTFCSQLCRWSVLSS